jgi:hypothetical protein
MQKNCTIFGKFNLTGSTDKHFNGTFWTQVGLKNLLETFSSIDVYTKGLGFSNDISVSVN